MSERVIIYSDFRAKFGTEMNGLFGVGFLDFITDNAMAKRRLAKRERGDGEGFSLRA